MGPVLEGAAKLGGVDGQSEWLVGGGANVDIGVLLDGGATASGAGEGKGQRVIRFLIHMAGTVSGWTAAKHPIVVFLLCRLVVRLQAAKCM